MARENENRNRGAHICSRMSPHMVLEQSPSPNHDSAGIDDHKMRQLNRERFSWLLNVEENAVRAPSARQIETDESEYDLTTPRINRSKNAD